MKPLLKFLTKNYDKIIISVILIIASFYRLYRIRDYLTFLGDEEGMFWLFIKYFTGALRFWGPRPRSGDFSWDRFIII